MDAKMARKHPAFADEKLRAEPTSRPVRMLAINGEVFGWHPIVVPVTASARA